MKRLWRKDLDIIYLIFEKLYSYSFIKEIYFLKRNVNLELKYKKCFNACKLDKNILNFKELIFQMFDL